MTTHDVLFLLLTVLVLVLASVLVGIIGFGLARWTGAAVLRCPTPSAVPPSPSRAR